MRENTLRKDSRGQMPFAMIAVTLLLLTAFYGIICYSVENKEENTENLTDELMSVSEGIDDTEKYIEAGLGNIINEISTDKKCGNLTKRIDRFNENMGNWFSNSFPLVDKGASVELLDYDIELVLRNMKLSSGDGVEDENEASYLEAVGTATVRYITESTDTKETLQIAADGLSGLPFVINSCTKFELSSTGGQSVLIELMSYQLTALAEYRILNGYGSTSEGGKSGTDSIITEEDVREAFRNSLSVLESLCFRTNGEGISDYVLKEHIDVADLLITDEDGYITIDISSIFSQTLMSMMDLLVTKWFDFVGGDVALDILDDLGDIVRECANCIISFFTGGSVDRSSATYYLKQLMERYDVDEDSFRYLGAQRYSIQYDGGTYQVTYKGKAQTVTVPAMTIDVDSERIDLFDWNGWNGFADDYHDGRNDMRELIKTYVHSISNDISEGMGCVKVKVDIYDSVTFAQELNEAIEKALVGGWDSAMELVDERITDSKVNDPLYSAIYDRIREQRSSIYNESGFAQYVENEVRGKIESYITSRYGSMADDTLINRIMGEIRGTGQFDSIRDRYSDSVSEKMRMFDEILNNVPKDTDSFVKQILVNAGKKAFDALGIFDKIRDTATAMCKEMILCMEANSQSGIIDLEKERTYLLYDGDGNSHREYISLSDDYELSVDIVSPIDNPSKNCHNVGLEGVSLASYTATYTIGIKATLNYEATSSTSTLMSLGSSDAEYSNGMKIDTVMDIPCVSGWALAGVDYQPSTNVLNEIWKTMLEFLEPILGPLTELYRALEALFNMCFTAVVEISTFVSELVQRIYELLMKPIEMLSQFIDGFLDTMVSSIVSAFNIGLNKQTFVLSVFGFTLKLETKLATLYSSTKYLAKITLEKVIGDTTASVFVELKQKSEKYLLQFGGGFKNDDCKLHVEIDPQMKFGKEIVSADGYIRDVAFDISLPTTVTYEKVEMKLSDVPGVSEVISNIALPIPDVKGSFDMGFELKYNLPFNTGLVINEFESNPAGKDAGKEWVELYNGSVTSMDLNGYVLTPGSNQDGSMVLSGTIEPMGHMVVYFDDETLCNSKTKNTNGEKLTLYDPEGNKINETGWKKDTTNNDSTWQRKSDGASTWVFKQNTEGKANGNAIDANAIEEKFFVEQLTGAMDSALDRLDGHIRSYEDASNFLKYTVQYFISNVINKIGDCLVSAMAYLQLQLDDYTSSLHGGIRVALTADSDMVEEGLRWILSQIDFLADYVKSPSCNDPLQLVCENVYVATSVYGEIGTPTYLKKIGDRVNIAFMSSVNVSGLCSLVGIEEGKWKAKVGIVMEDIPGKLLPSPLKKNTDKHCDLWLIRAEFSQK